MFENRVTLFRLFGFPIKVDWSWLIVAVLVSWSLATGFIPAYYPALSGATRWTVGIVAALGLFFSIVLHEVSHALVARKFDMPIRSITLFIFGGVAELEDEPPSPRAELLVAAAGPVTSAAVAVLAYVVFGLAGPQGGAVRALAHYLWRLNLVVALFNLLPAFPLDGGRILRSLLWRWRGSLTRSTRSATTVSSVIAFLIMGFGFYLMFVGGLASGLWLVFIGFIVRSASRMSYQRVLMTKALAGERVSRFMNAEPITVDAGITIRQLVEDYVYAHHYKMFPVTENGRLLGCVTTREIKAIPSERWEIATAAEIAGACDQDNTVSPDTDAVDALAQMNRTGNSRLMVSEDGRLVGVVALKDMLRFLSLKLDLEPNQLVDEIPGRE